MLSKTVENALINQIAQEAFASAYYLSMASWAEVKGLKGISEFFFSQSEEERGHMLKLFKYINETGGHAHVPEIKKVPGDFTSVVKVFELALKQERENTKNINALVDVCLNTKDYSTFNFLQWYVSEQHEEEMLFTSILDKITIIGTEGKGVYWIDKEVQAISRTAERK